VLFQQLLIDGANRTPDKRALYWVDRDRSATYAEAVEATDRVAGALHDLGVGPGDRVGIFAHNGLDYLLAMFGTWRLGAISALVNVDYAATLDYYLNDAKPLVLVYTGDKHDVVEALRARVPSVRHFVCLDGPRDGALAWDELLSNSPGPPPDATRETDVAHLSYTSGTSGKPKGACLAHEPTTRATRCIAERLRITGSDISFGPTALSSSYQLVANVLPTLHRGGTVCVTSRWQAEAGWAALDALEATVLAANPTVLADVLETSTREGRPPHALRLAVSGGAPVPAAIKRAWRDDLGITLAESYGQSELGGFVGLGLPEPVSDDKLLACGPPLPDKEVRILDDNGLEVPIGETGEICIRGGFMAGYWERPEQTAAALRGGWLHTGDVGYMDAQQYVFVRGRHSERLELGGEYWYPRDVEEVLDRHPAVRQAALVGRRNSTGRIIPIAYITTTDGAPDETELVRSVVEALGRAPDGLTIRTLDEMPMTPTGKISKAELLALTDPLVPT
jgi:acyl-CoA synthetase (AMP-forming)/AMP-acid ligase II